MFNRLTMILCGISVVAHAATADSGTPGNGSMWRAEPAATDVRSFIGVNNLQMLVSNVGSFAFDPSGSLGKQDGLYFPRGSNTSVVFAAGLWVGAKVNGSPRVSIAEYSNEYTPGGMLDGTYQNDQPHFHVYKISRGDDAASNPDYAGWPFDDGAPALANAAGEDSLDEFGNRIPLVIGDQTLYAVYNDADVASHTNGAGSTLPLGIEVQQTVFAFGRSGSLGNTIYLKYKIINKGENTLEDAYVSLWSDPDVGDASDDFVGCDTSLSLGFAYNEGDDVAYGAGVPAVGFDFLQGPMVPSAGDSALCDGNWRQGFRNLPMTSFNKYTNGTDPQNSTETYNYMQGLTPTGEPVLDPDGHPTVFQVAGDPVTGEGWLDFDAGDRRSMMSSGPFTMAPGDTQVVVVAVLVGQGADELSSITALKSVDDQVQQVFDLNFQIPFPPPQPMVWAQPLANRIQLIWDTQAEGDIQVSEALGQQFVMEGYNVYQGESPSGPWKKIATYDVANDVARIYQDQFDPQLGTVQRVQVQQGSNSGLANSISLTTDRLRGIEIINHRPYHYAVTVYSYDELNVQEYMVGPNVVGHLTEVLESGIQAIEVVPNSIALPLVDTALHAAGFSDGRVTLHTLDIDELTGHEYEVTFNADQTWNLDDVTTSTRLLSEQDPSSEHYTDPIVDGMMVTVYGPPAGVREVVHSDGDDAWVTGYNWGGYYYHGTVDEGCYFFGSSICDPYQLVDVELRFSPTVTQKAYRYLRGTTPSYPYSGYGTVPFTAWDVSQDPHRQLNVCFVEQFQLASEDNYWLPPDGDETGGREYIFILNSDYSEEPDPFYTGRSIFHNAEEFDVLYAWWPAIAEGHSGEELADGQTMTFTVNKYNTVDDRFSFKSQRAGDDESQAGASLSGVYAVPNPYLHGTDLESDQRHRLIKFAGLPAVDATVEIYNLVGERIRVLTKEHPEDAEVHWDVLTSGGLPPASGVYLYRVIAPGLKPHFGKLALFIDRERLKQF